MIHVKQFPRILRSGSGHSVLPFVQKKKIQIKYDICKDYLWIEENGYQ